MNRCLDNTACKHKPSLATLNRDSFPMFILAFVFGGLLSMSTWSPNVLASGDFPTDNFEIPEGAYNATFVEDSNHVTVMTFSGVYDKELEGGQFNRAARAKIAQEFYRTHPDNYDFLVTFTSFEFETGDAVAFYHGVKNDVQGIGFPQFDNSELYGSQNKLQGFIDMAAMSRYVFNPFDPQFEFPLSALSHEILHRWGIRVQYQDQDGNPSNKLLGKDNTHWNFFLNTSASVEYGHQWKDNQDGTFTATGARRFYSPLDLYLMGVNSAEEVEDFFLLNPTDSTYSPFDASVKGAKVSGTKEYISINDIVALEGPRIPSAEHAQKEFRIGFIYLVGENENVDVANITKIDTFRRAFMDRFAILTGGRGIAHVYPEAMPLELGEDTGISAAQSDVIRVEEANVEDALAWLRSQQNVFNGYWNDTDSTRIRDTSVILNVLENLDDNFVTAFIARDWLSAQSPENTDSLSRILLSRPTSNSTELATTLTDRQNQDGGWGLIPGYKSNVLDTALAVRALYVNNASPSVTDAGLNYLFEQQNTSFAWPETKNGSSSLSATLSALDAFLATGLNDHLAVNNAFTWILAQQNIDGGFGRPLSTVHETAEVLTLAANLQKDGTIDATAALGFINERQRSSGGWEGSQYVTAMAAQALRSISRQNLAISQFTADLNGKKDGERVKLTVGVTNDSPLNAEATSLQLYLGDPSNGGVTLLLPVSVPVLIPGQSVSFDFIWDTLDQVGVQHLFAVVDPAGVLLERSRTDNTATLEYTVAEAPEDIDLEISLAELLVTPENPSQIPEALAFSAVVRNLGKTNANNVVVQLWQGEANSGTLLDEQTINVANRSSVAANLLADLSQAGDTTFTVVVDPDNAIAESNKNNNSVSRVITTSASVDLEVTSADISYAPNPALILEDTVITFTVRNRGTVDTPNVNIITNIQTVNGVVELQNTQASFLAGESKTFTTQWRPDVEGDSTIRVILDEDNVIAESNESNNTATEILSVQQLEGSNVSVKSTDVGISPNPVNEGLGATVSAIVVNTGTVDLTSVNVSFYDGDPSTGGLQIGDDLIVAQIDAGQSVNLSHVWSQVVGDHDRFIFVTLDAANDIDEFNETDNVGFFKVEVNSSIDLAISEGAITLSPSFPKLGDTATLTARVNNQGKQAANDVLVRAYRGNPESGGTQIGDGYTIDTIAGFSSSTVQFDVTFDTEGVQEIYIVVDPDGSVLELNRANNTARKRVAIQDGNFYVSQRYMSPNGDGVKDSSSYFFGLDTSDTVSVVVLDNRDKEVKTFDTLFVDVVSGDVEWDGRSDGGGIVNDGDYTFAIKTSAGLYAGSAKVTIDTNRSSLVYALDTQFEYRNNLTCAIGRVVNNRKDGDYEESSLLLGDHDVVSSPDNEFIYFLTNGQEESLGSTFFVKGLYRSNSDGSNVTMLSDLDGIPSLTNRSNRDIIVSDDGERVVITGHGYFADIWDFDLSASPATVRSIGTHQAYRAAAFRPGTHELYLVDADNPSEEQAEFVVKAWDLQHPVPAEREVYRFNYLTEEFSFFQVKFESNVSGSHFALQVLPQAGDRYESNTPDYDSFADVGKMFAEFSFQLHLIDALGGSGVQVGLSPSAFDWSPDGNKVLVGDAPAGGLFIYSLQGDVLQNLSFNAPQFLLEPEDAFYLNALPEAYRENGALLGHFVGVSYSPDGLEYGFVFEDYTTATFLELASQDAGGFKDEGTGTAKDAEISNIQIQSYHGIYVVDVKTNSFEKAAELQEVFFSNENPNTEFPDYEDFEQDDFGNYIAESGLPIIPTVGNVGEIDGVNSSLAVTPTRFARRVDWMPGSRSLLISGRMQDLNFSSTNWSTESRAYIVGFDKSVNTRRILAEDKIDVFRVPVTSSTGRYLHFYSRNANDACGGGYHTSGSGTRQIRSLMNLTADLRAFRSSKSGGISLSGTAVDVNFDSYALEFTSVNEPNNWQPVMPASTVHQVNQSFTTWVPPDEGSYYVRLTVTDLAGNQRRAIKRASVAERPSITSLYRSPSHFSPNGDTVSELVNIHFKVLENVNLNVAVINDSGTTVRTIQQDYTNIGAEEVIAWDGRDDSGLRVADGVYTLKVQNYELFVNLDTTFPVIADLTPKWFNFEENKRTESIHVSLKDEIDVSLTDDGSVPEARIEYRENNSAQWQDIEADIYEKSGILYYQQSHKITDWIKGEYRIWVQDIAGNTSVEVIPRELKIDQAAITAVASNLGSYYPRLSTSRYDEPLSFNSEEELALNGNPFIEMEVSESIFESISSVEFVFADQSLLSDSASYTGEEADIFVSVPVSQLGQMGPCSEELAEEGDRCFVVIETTDVNVFAKQKFGVRIDVELLDLDISKKYRAFLRFRDVAGLLVNTNSFVLSPAVSFKAEFSPISFDASGTPYLELGAGPLNEDDLESVTVTVESTQDQRYFEPTVIAELTTEKGDFNSWDGSSVRSFIFDVSDWLVCSQYSAKAVFVFTNGDTKIINSGDELSVPCFSVKMDAYPVIPESCDDPATQIVKISGVLSSNVPMNQRAYFEPTELKELIFGVRQAGSDNLNTLYNKNNPEYGGLYQFDLDVSLFEEGNLEVVAQLTDINDNLSTWAVNVPIVHEAPSLEITYPIEGQSYCANQYTFTEFNSNTGKSVTVEKRGIDVQGIAQSKGTHTYDVFVNGERTDCQNSFYSEILGNDSCKSSRTFTDQNGLKVQSARMVSNSLSHTSSVKGTLGFLLFDEDTIAAPGVDDDERTFELQQYNWAGVKSCSAVTIKVDDEITDLEVSYSSVSAASKFRFEDKILPLYSPNLDGQYDLIEWNYGIGENVNLTVEINTVDMTISESGLLEVVSITPFTMLESNYRVTPGYSNFSWGGQSAPDGFYQVVFNTEDDCGLTAVNTFTLEIDNTAPTLAISHPTAGSALGIVVEPLGTVTEHSNYTYTVSVGQNEDEMSRLFASGLNRANFTDKILAVWNTFGLQDTWFIKLSATDSAGNSASILQEVILPDRAPIISLLEATERFLSPNGDSKLDAAIFRVYFEHDARATIEILNSNDNVVEVLASDQNYNIGLHNIRWDGLDELLLPYNDGEYQIRVTAQSALGGGSIQTELTTITLDKTPPLISVDRLLNNILGVSVISSSLPITGSITDVHYRDFNISVISDPSGDVSYSLNSLEGEIPIVFASLTPETFDQQGLYRLRVKASDFAENSTSFEFDLLYDSVKPVVSIDEPANEHVFSSSALNVVLAGNIEEENLLSYSVSLAAKSDLLTLIVNQNYDNYSEGQSLASIDVSGLPDGDYQIAVVALDRGGLNDRKTVDISIDNTAPSLNISSVADNDFVTQGAPILGTAYDLHLEQYKVQLAPGNTPNEESFVSLINATNNVNSGALFNWSVLPSDGVYTLRLTAVDTAGNSNTLDRIINIDTHAPEAPTIGDLIVNSEANTLSVNWLASQSEDLEGYFVYRNGTQLNTAPISVLNFVDTNIIDGEYIYSVRAVDLAGLISEPSAKEWVVDNTPPIASITRPATNALVSEMVSVSGTASSESDFKGYRILVGQNEETLVEVHYSGAPIIAGELAQLDTTTLTSGVSYIVRLEAEDTHGNVSKVDISVTVDNEPPAAPTGLQVTLTENNADITWAQSPEADLEGYILLRGDSVVNAPDILVGSLSPYLLSQAVYADMDLNDGRYDYVVIAMDSAGNLSDPSEPVSIVVDIRAPHAEFSGIEDGQVFENSVYIGATVVDEDVASIDFQYRLGGSSDAWQSMHIDTNEAYEIVWDTTALAYANYDIQLVAVDTNANTDSAPASITVSKQDITRPLNVLLTTINVNTGEPTVQWAQSDDADLAGYIVYRRSLNSGDASNENWTEINTDVLTATTLTDVDLSDAVYDYYVTVEDAAGNESEPSNVLSGLVFTPRFEVPFSPTIETQISIAGETVPFASVTFEAVVLGSIVNANVVSDENGGFVFPPIELGLGNHDYSISAINQDGFSSRVVSGKFKSVTAPAQVVGVTATTSVDESEAQVRWDENLETNLIGYRVYSDGISVNDVTQATGLTFETDGPSINSMSNMTDGSASTYWNGSNNTSYLDVILPESTLVSGVDILWFRWYYSAAEMDILVWDEEGEQYLKLDTVFKPREQTDQVISFSKPYQTNRIRILFKAKVFSSLVISILNVNSLELSNTVDFFTHAPEDGFHTYQVSAINDSGIEGPLSEPQTIAVGDVVPPAAVTLTASVNGSDVNLSWTESASTDVSEYRIFRDDQLIYDTEADVFSFADDYRTNGTYVYKVRPIDQAGNTGEFSNEVVVTVAVAELPSPVNVSVELNGTEFLTLNWQAAPDSNPDYYNVYRSVDNAEPFDIVEDTGGSQYRDYRISIGKTYRYYVTALDEIPNESAPSATVEVAVLDVLAPEQPNIVLPTRAGQAVVSDAFTVNIIGNAEPGSTVYLNQNGTIDLQVQVPVYSYRYRTGDFTDIALTSSDLGMVAGVSESPDTFYQTVYLNKGEEWITVGDYNSLGLTPRDVFLAGSKLFISGYGKLVVWDTQTETRIHQVAGLPHELNNMFDYSEETNTLYGSSYNGGIFEFNIDTQVSTLIQPLSGNGFASPDGQYIAHVYESTSTSLTIELFDRISQEFRTILLADTYVNLSTPLYLDWSEDGKRFLVRATTSASYYDQIHVFDIDTEQLSLVVADENMHLSNPSWSVDGESVIFTAYNGDDDTFIASYSLSSGDTKLLLPTSEEYEFSHVVVSTDSFIAYGYRYGGLTAVNGLGRFKIENVDLNVGLNVFSVTSVDVSGNESAPSEEIEVTRNVPDFADLSATVNVPSNLPSLGDTVSFDVLVTNSGTALSTETTAIFSIRSQSDGGITNLDTGVLVPALDVGESITLRTSWLASSIGEFDFIAYIDVTNVVVESEENNNTALASLQVVESALPFMRVTLNGGKDGSPKFGANEIVSGNITVINASQLFTGVCTIRVVDAAGYLVTDLVTVTLENMIYGAIRDIQLSWNTGATFSGDYRIEAVLTSTDNTVVDDISSNLKITDDVRYISSVSSVSPTYRSNADVRLNTTIVNAGGNAIFDGAQATVTIEDSNGVVVFTSNVSVGQILPNARSQFSTIWNTANYQPDNYVVKLTVDPSQEIDSQVSLAGFNIIPGVPTLTGQLVESSIDVGKGQATNVQFNLVNRGNAALTNLVIDIHVLDLELGTVLESSELNVELGYQAQLDLSGAVDASNLAIGKYGLHILYSVAAFGVEYSGQLDQTILSVLDVEAPTLEFIAPEVNTITNSAGQFVRVSAQDADSSIDHVYMAFDTNVQKLVASRDANAGANIYTYSLDGLADGLHTVFVTAVDTAGNTSGSIERSFTIDNTDPVITVSDVESGIVYGSLVRPLINVTDVNLGQVEITLNGEAYISGTEIIADGDYQLTIIAYDVAGNTSTDAILFGIDSVGALISVEGVADGSQYNTAVTPLITITDANLLSSSIVLNGEAFESNTLLTQEGYYQLEITATDVTGRVSFLALSFDIDLTPPDAPIVVSPANNTTVGRDRVDVLGTAEAESMLVLRNLDNDTIYNANVDVNGNFIVADVLLTTGTNRFEIEAVDQAGNTSATTQLNVALSVGTVDVEVENGIGSRGRVLIWTSEKHSYYHSWCYGRNHSGHDSSYGDYGIDLEATIELVQDAYDEAGIAYDIVRSPWDFITAVRTHKYNVINLINLHDRHSQSMLFGGVQDMELRAAVLSGVGLIANFTRPHSFYFLHDMMGANVGGITTNNSITLNNSMFGDGLQLMLNDTALSVTLNGGVGVGIMKHTHDGCGYGNTCNQSAIVLNKYGLGDTVLVPFNLPDIDDRAQAKELVVNLTEYAKPDQEIILPGTTHMLDWKLSSLESLDNLVVQQQLSANLNYESVLNGGIIDDSSPNEQSVEWVFNNIDQESLWFSAMVTTPTSSGNYLVNTQVFDSVVLSSNQVVSDQLNLSVTSSLSELENELVTKVKTLPISWRGMLALLRIESAQGLYKNSHYMSNLAILWMVLAIDDLRHLDDTEDMMITAAQITAAYQSKWVEQVK